MYLVNKLISFLIKGYLKYKNSKIKILYPNVTLNLGSNVRIYNPKNIFFKEKAYIGDNVLLNSDRGGRIFFGRNIIIAEGTKIISWNHDFSKDDFNKHPTKNKDIVIGDDVWIGYNCIILPGSKIGNRCKISAGTVINGEYEDDLQLFGNPCRSLPNV